MNPTPEEIRQMIKEGEQTLADERNLRVLEKLGFDPDTVAKWDPDIQQWVALKRNLDDPDEA